MCKPEHGPDRSEPILLQSKRIDRSAIFVTGRYVMSSFKVDANTSRNEIQQRLERFGPFSRVEASVLHAHSTSGVVFLREVGIMERFARLFSKGSSTRDHQQQSREAMLKLAEIHPEIGKLLGTPMLERHSWSTAKLKQSLKVGSDKLEPAKDGSICIVRPEPLGIANVKIDQLHADSKIRWSFPSDAGAAKEVHSQAKKENEIVITLPAGSLVPEDHENIYRAALGNASGHVVIEPLPDSSNEAIDRLLKVVDEFRSKPDWKGKQITIATGAQPGLADRIWDRKARLDAAARQPKEGVVGMPKALRVLAESMEKVAKSAGIDAAGLCESSSMSHISFYQGDPAQLASDVLFLQPQQIRQRSLALHRQGFGQLQQVYQQTYEEDGLVGTEAQTIMKKSAEGSGIAGVELPACELPAKQLFAFSATSQYPTTREAAVEFFVSHLRGVSGRIVIALTGDPAIDGGAWDAACKMKLSSGPDKREVIFAAADATVLKAAQQLGQ